MNANETSTVDRWYVRCVDCLSIGAVEVNPYRQNWKCGVCAGNIEVMGKVVMDKLETEHVRSACDARCTHARGPLCVCRCGCANHGTGRIVRVVTKHDIPTIEFTDADEALKIATAYRDAMKEAETSLNGTRSSYFYGYWKVRGLLKKAHEARKHETRMKRIAEAMTLIADHTSKASEMSAQRTERDAYVMNATKPAPVVSRVAITGNTYPVRDYLKKLGGVWDSFQKAWMIPADKAEEARNIVAAATPAPKPAAVVANIAPVQPSFDDAIPF